MAQELTIRLARAEDRPAMEQICAQTWDWGDYVPEVWDNWLADEQGTLIVGDLDSQTVALSKITFLSPDQVWLEGMRVHPAFRRHGIAEQFLRYSLAYARERGARVVRLGTGDHNSPVHTIADRAGMQRVGRYVLWSAEAQPGAASPVFLTPSQIDRVQRFLSVSQVYTHTRGLFSVDWSWQELSEEQVCLSLVGGTMTALCSTDGDILALALIHVDPSDRALWIGFSDGLGGSPPVQDRSALAELARSLRTHALACGAASARAMLPDVAQVRDAYHAAGYGFGDWEGELWVFERQLHDALGSTHDL